MLSRMRPVRSAPIVITLLITLLAPGGCGPAPTQSPGSKDAGARADAGRGTDAGTDAGASDAGVVVDAGTDAGASDAGAVVDAGTDGGTTDAGPADAGPADAGPADGGSCTPVALTAAEATPSIVVLVDGSSSMSVAMGNSTRFDLVRAALTDPSGAIARLQAKAYFGASVFASTQACPQLASVLPSLNNAPAIANLLASYAPAGSTPTALAIGAVVSLLSSHAPPAGSPPMIVLVTDGLPNDCSSTTPNTGPAITAAGNAYAAGVPLDIVGIAGVDTTYLQQMANAGAGVTAGQPGAAYFTGSDLTSLESAFGIIFDRAVCRLTISGGTVDTAKAATGTVTLDGTALTYGTDWDLADGSTINLVGTACSSFEADAAPTVGVSFPCDAVTP